METPQLNNLSNQQIKNVFMHPLQVYFAEGTVDLTGFIYLLNQKNHILDNDTVPFGRLNQDAGSISTEPEIVEIHKQGLTTGHNINLQLNSLEMTKNVFDYFMDKSNKKFTFVFVPLNDKNQAILLLTDVNLNRNLNFSINGDLAVINCSSTKQVDELSQCLFLNRNLFQYTSEFQTDEIVGIEDIKNNEMSLDYLDDLYTYTVNMYPYLEEGTEGFSQLSQNWLYYMLHNFNNSLDIPIDFTDTNLDSLIIAGLPLNIREQVEAGFLPKNKIYKTLNNDINQS